MGFSLLAARKMERDQKMKDGGRGGEGRKFSSFLPHPLPALLLTLATQARRSLVTRLVLGQKMSAILY